MCSQFSYSDPVVLALPTIIVPVTVSARQSMFKTPGASLVAKGTIKSWPLNPMADGPITTPSVDPIVNTSLFEKRSAPPETDTDTDS